MCNAAMAQFGTAAVSMGANYSAISNQEQMSDAVAHRNARLLDAQASDALARGEKKAGQVQLQASQLTGAQRAAMASSGIDIQQSGTALDVLASSQAVAQYEQEMVRANAGREAWGYTTEAKNVRIAGKVKKQGYEDAKVGTIIGGFGGMLGAAGSGFGGGAKFGG